METYETNDKTEEHMGCTRSVQVASPAVNNLLKCAKQAMYEEPAHHGILMTSHHSPSSCPIHTIHNRRIWYPFGHRTSCPPDADSRHPRMRRPRHQSSQSSQSRYGRRCRLRQGYHNYWWTYRALHRWCCSKGCWYGVGGSDTQIPERRCSCSCSGWGCDGVLQYDIESRRMYLQGQWQFLYAVQNCCLGWDQMPTGLAVGGSCLGVGSEEEVGHDLNILVKIRW